jgi:hypothetical protein
MIDGTPETFAKARRWLIDECKSCAEVLASNRSIALKKIAQRKLAEIYAAIQAIDIARKKLTPSEPPRQIEKLPVDEVGQSNKEI